MNGLCVRSPRLRDASDEPRYATPWVLGKLSRTDTDRGDLLAIVPG